MTAPVYILDNLREYANASAQSIVVEGDEARHAISVRRTQTGEKIDLCDGRGLRARCTVSAVEGVRLHVTVEEYADERAIPTRYVLVQSLAKGGRDEEAIDICTQYGVHEIIPWFAQRAVVSWKGKEDKRRSRWQALAQAAAKQSRRSWIPTVSTPVTTSALAEKIREATARGVNVFLCHEKAEAELKTIARQAPASVSKDVWILIGPEGGIGEDEREDLTQAGAVCVLLSPQVLRSATAGAYALATLEAVRETGK